MCVLGEGLTAWLAWSWEWGIPQRDTVFKVAGRAKGLRPKRGQQHVTSLP